MRHLCIKLSLAVLCVFTMTACPSLWKHAHIINLTDDSGKIVGKIGAFQVHYPKGNSDSDGTTTYPDDHSLIAVTNANVDDSISADDFAKISAIGVKFKLTGQYLTGDKYMCDKSIDPANPAFGCRVPDAWDYAIVNIEFKLNDGSHWKSDDIDLTNSTESSELDADINSIIDGFKSGKVTMYTLKACPPDASGKVIDVKTSETCPSDTVKDTYATPTSDTSCPPGQPGVIDQTTKVCTPTKPTQQQLCTGGNYYLLGGNCGSTCGANHVVRMGKCACQNGFMEDPSNKASCIVDPSFDANIPASPSTGGGGCSLIR